MVLVTVSEHDGLDPLPRQLERELGADERALQGQLVEPEITGPHAWGELAALTADPAGRWVLDTADDEVSGWGEIGESGALLVGPEGGWSPRERDELRAAGWRTVGLGERVLRAETAAVVGAALLLTPRVDTRAGSG